MTSNINLLDYGWNMFHCTVVKRCRITVRNISLGSNIWCDYKTKPGQKENYKIPTCRGPNKIMIEYKPINNKQNFKNINTNAEQLLFYGNFSQSLSTNNYKYQYFFYHTKKSVFQEICKKNLGWIEYTLWNTLKLHQQCRTELKIPSKTKMLSSSVILERFSATKEKKQT